MTKYDRYEVGALVDLLPGWSGQSRFLHGLYAMASMLIFGALLLVAIATFTFEKDGSSSQSGIVALSLLVGMLISLAWSLIALWMLPYRAEDEEPAGRDCRSSITGRVQSCGQLVRADSIIGKQEPSAEQSAPQWINGALKALVSSMTDATTASHSPGVTAARRWPTRLQRFSRSGHSASERHYSVFRLS
jgi:hypothetical protein